MADDPCLPSSTAFDSAPARLDLSTTKRKFEDAHADKETARTGFSDKPESGAGGGGNPTQKPGMYSSVPPPLSDFEVAKQKAAQIAARLVSSAPPPLGAVAGAEPVKRSRTDDNGSDVLGDSNGPSQDRGFGEAERVSKFHDVPTDNQSSYEAVTEFQPMPYHNHQISFSESRKMDVPVAKVGMVIGKGGETIKNLQYQSGAKIQVTRDADADPSAPTRQVEIMGTSEQISRAEQLIKDVIAESAIGGFSSFAARGFGGAITGEQASIRVLNSKVGLIIGRGGETIRSLQSRSGARIQFAVPQDGEQGTLERVITLTGTKEQTDMASELIKELVDENRVRGPSMHGGYNQQYFRPPGPPQHWGPPGPPAYPAYGYQQQGPYPGPPHQYPPPPQQYGGYTQAPPGWNQTTPGPPQQASDQGSYNQPQQTPQQASYDSYSQQSQQGQMQQAPQPGADATDGSYAYNQQGYYGSYQQQPSVAYQQQEYQGFSQPQQSYNQPQEGFSQLSEGYNQPQQGYGSQQGGYNQPQGYAQQAYNGGYEYSQASQDQQAYGQHGYPQQSYGDQSQFAQSSEGSLQQSTAGIYNYNPGSQPAAAQGVMSSAAES